MQELRHSEEITRELRVFECSHATCAKIEKTVMIIPSPFDDDPVTA